MGKLKLDVNDLFLDTDNIHFTFAYRITDVSLKLQKLSPKNCTHIIISTKESDNNIREALNAKFKVIGEMKSVIGLTECELKFLQLKEATPEELFLNEIQRYISDKPYKISSKADRVVKGIIKKGGNCPCRIDTVPCPCPNHVSEIESEGACLCGLLLDDSGRF